MKKLAALLSVTLVYVCISCNAQDTGEDVFDERPGNASPMENQIEEEEILDDSAENYEVNPNLRRDGESSDSL